MLSSNFWLCRARLVAFLIVGGASCGGASTAGRPPLDADDSGGAGGSGGTTTAGAGGTAGKPSTTGGAGGNGGSSGAQSDAATNPDASRPDAGVAPPADSGGDQGGGVTAGMTKIFDGTTLMGWQGNPTLWSVKDGALDGNGTTNGEILMSSADYGDFRLIVQSRMIANTGRGHLGICFWGGRMPTGKYNGCKLVIPPQGGSWDYGGGGGLPGITHPMTGMFKVSDWHQTELLCRQATGTCRMATDGIEVLDYKEPNPGRLKKGPIGFQIHAGTSEVQYKDVYVDPAPTDDTLRTAKKP